MSDEPTENKPNKANLPVKIALFWLFIQLIITIWGMSLAAVAEEPSPPVITFWVIYVISWILFLIFSSIVCPIYLYFQIKNSNKTKRDKIWLAINAVYSVAAILYLLFIIAYIITILSIRI